MSESKADRARRFARDRKRRQRDRQAEAAQAAEQQRITALNLAEMVRWEQARHEAEEQACIAKLAEARRTCKKCGKQPPAVVLWPDGDDRYCPPCYPTCQIPGCGDPVKYRPNGKPALCSTHFLMFAGFKAKSETAADLWLEQQLAPPKGPQLPPIRKPDPLTIDPRTDPYRPSWWTPSNGLGLSPIKVGLHPLQVGPTVLGSPDGNTVLPPADRPAMTYSDVDGHQTPATREEAARQLQEFADKARPGSAEMYRLLTEDGTNE